VSLCFSKKIVEAPFEIKELLLWFEEHVMVGGQERAMMTTAQKEIAMSMLLTHVCSCMQWNQFVLLQAGLNCYPKIWPYVLSVVKALTMLDILVLDSQMIQNQL